MRGPKQTSLQDELRRDREETARLEKGLERFHSTEGYWVGEGDFGMDQKQFEEWVENKSLEYASRFAGNEIQTQVIQAIWYDAANSLYLKMSHGVDADFGEFGG